MVIPYMCCGGLCGGVVNDPQTPDLEVRGLSLAHCVVSLDKELYSTLSLFTQEYKCVLATYCWGVTLQWTCIPSRGSSNTPRCFMLWKRG